MDANGHGDREGIPRIVSHSRPERRGQVSDNSLAVQSAVIEDFVHGRAEEVIVSQAEIAENLVLSPSGPPSVIGDQGPFVDDDDAKMEELTTSGGTDVQESATKEPQERQQYKLDAELEMKNQTQRWAMMSFMY